MKCPQCKVTDLLSGKDAVESLTKRYGNRLEVLALIDNIQTDFSGYEWGGYCPLCNAFIGREYPHLTELKITIGNKETRWKFQKGDSGWVHFVEADKQ